MPETKAQRSAAAKRGAATRKRHAAERTARREKTDRTERTARSTADLCVLAVRSVFSVLTRAPAGSRTA